MQQVTNELLSEENAELRKIIASLGYCTSDASLEFMRLIPEEVKRTRTPDQRIIGALREAEPLLETLHSITQAKDARAIVWRAVKKVREALASLGQKQGGGDE